MLYDVTSNLTKVYSSVLVLQLPSSAVAVTAGADYGKFLIFITELRISSTIFHYLIASMLCILGAVGWSVY